MLLLTASCGPLGPATFDPDAGGEELWASREQIIEAAARCGVPNFEPKKLPEGWGPWVSGEDPDKGPKTRCIVNRLHAQDLQVTH